MKTFISLFLLFCFSETFGQVSYPVTFTHAGKTVFGTFAVPHEGGVFPTIIIVPGSGPNDRDGSIIMLGGNALCLYPGLFGKVLKPYKGLSEALLDSGYAVLRYDKLEFTYPPGSIGPITFHKLWLPVESAIDFIKTRDDVDTNRIILIGHSEGSSMIPYIAKSRTDIKALISVSGPRTPLDTLLAYQVVYIAHECNGDTIDAKNLAEDVLEYFDIIRSNEWDQNTPPFSGVPASVMYDYIRVLDSVAINYNLADLPTLFLGLGDDYNVPLTELERFQNEIEIDADFWTIDGLNHLFTTHNDPAVSQVLTDTIIYWLRQLELPTGVVSAEEQINPFKVFPNPFSSVITIQMDSHIKGEITIHVRDACGKNVLPPHVINATYMIDERIDFGNLPAGIYFLEMQTNGHRFIETVIKLQHNE